MRKTMAALLLAGSAMANGASFETVGEAQPFLPGVVARAHDELQATVHPVEKIVLFGCTDCPGADALDLWVITNRGSGWSAPGRSPISRHSSESMPSFSSDGAWLYFVADREGGFGGKDLYRSYFKSYRGVFSPPELLEGTINSKGTEGGAAANDQGGMVVFASEGRKGAKGWDLFVSRRRAGKMTEAERLESVDTDADEFDPALLANGAGLVFARADKIDGKNASLWFAPTAGDGFGTPVKLADAINKPGSNARGPQQDWSAPDQLLFTRDGDIHRIAYRIVP